MGSLKLSSIPTVASAQTAWNYLCSVHPNLTSHFPSRPTNPEHLPLLDLHIARKPALNPSRQNKTRSAMDFRFITGNLCHVTGIKRAKSCQRCQTGCGMWDTCVVAPSGDSQDVMAGQCSNCFIDQCDKCIWDHDERPFAELGSAEYFLTKANRCLPPSSQPILDEKPEAARDKTTAGTDESEPQQGDYPRMEELSDSSYVEGQSDEEFIDEDAGLMSNEYPSSHQAQSRPLALTSKIITYDEVYEAARDPQADYKHCECPAWIVPLP